MAHIPTGQTDDPAAIIVELRRQLAARDGAYEERLAHQAATNDVLQAMSASPGDPQPVFELITRQAKALLGTPVVGLFGYDGELVHLRSSSGGEEMSSSAAWTAYASSFPRVPDRGSLTCRAILDATLIHIRDLAADPSVSPAIRDLGHRAQIAVPLMRDGRAIGAISTGSMRVDGISDSQIALLKTFAEQAVIAITGAETYRALQARTAELTERDADNRALIARQAASIEVLRAISASPDNAQPVLDLIVRRVSELANAQAANLFEYDGALLHLRAWNGFDPKAIERLLSAFPRPAGNETLPGRVILNSQVVHIPDFQADAQIFQPGRALGARAFLGVPLLRDGRVIGVLGMGRFDPGDFDQSAIELVQSFAEQAVIALSSAAALRELRLRTADLQESLDYQTATADVLKVISRSTFDLQPVLDTVAQTAARLCAAEQAAIFRYDGPLTSLVANCGFPPEYDAYMRARGAFQISPDSPTVGIRSRFERRAVHVYDAAAVPGYPKAAIELGKQRTSLGVPLMRDGEAIGSIILARQRVEPFTEQQIELVRTFADQAVIAIENTRLITEQREALEQQTATAEVLGVINASPGNLQPVFEAMLYRAMHLCDAAFGELHTFDGERLRPVALRGVPPELEAYLRRNGLKGGPGTTSYRIMAGEDVVHILDAREEDAYRRGDPARRASVDLGGVRSSVSVALRREGKLLGGIRMFRQVVKPFDARQIALLQNFASQAVIAIENARLITETREALEQQTATADVLQVINASPGELKPVFDAMLDKAIRLSGSAFGTLSTFDGEFFRLVAMHGITPEHADALQTPLRPVPGTASGRMLAGEDVVHVEDITASSAYRSGVAYVRAFADQGGARTAVWVALRKDDKLLGRIVIFRREVRPFTDKQIAMLRNFAAQAVIAMENARLITETRDARDSAEAALEDLRRTQDRLVQTEKMASLGQLTAGIAHEIKNPLNFVNNFSDLSVDLLDELNEAVAPGKIELPEDTRAEIDEITETLKGNLHKIAQHGRRADSIVKNMLLHSRTGASERRTANLNALAEEALNLAYHGARAEKQGFNITLERDFDPTVGEVEMYPQEISRVLVNLINNGFYAAGKRAEAEPGLEPALRLRTRNLGEQVEITVRDNGTGIPAAVRDKIFEPFFTTKPAGEGTGLGLSLSFDIIVKQHGGQLSVASQPGAFTEFTVILPRTLPTGAAR